MRIIQREFSGEEDIQAMMAVSQASVADNVHVVDLPFRLSSWALDCPENVGLWVSAEGQLRAWAVLQTPLWTIDLVFHPEFEARVLPPVLEWVDRRARLAASTAYGRPGWFVMALPHQAGRIRRLEQGGFACQADVGPDSWSKLLLQRPAPMPVPDCAAPPPYVIRPFGGATEVDAFVQLQRAVFESENMTAQWRARILRRPEYRPELDLVAAAADGRLVAFCLCWFLPGPEPGGQVEPMGVHPSFRGLGLGRAILSESLRRLSGCGAKRVLIETDSYRDAALGLYEAMGFCRFRDVLVYRRDYVGRGGQDRGL